MEDKRYTLGFNHGYILAKYLPDLLLKVVKNLQPKNSYLDGFFSGKEEYEFEKSIKRLNDLTDLRSQSKTKGKNRARE